MKVQRNNKIYNTYTNLSTCASMFLRLVFCFITFGLLGTLQSKDSEYLLNMSKTVKQQAMSQLQVHLMIIYLKHPKIAYLYIDLY